MKLLVKSPHSSAFSLTLNLLSAEDKQRIKSDLLLFVIRDIVLLVLLALIVVAILFIVSARTLDANYREILQASLLSEPERPAFQQRVLDLSEKSESLAKIKSGWDPISHYVSEVARAVKSPSTLTTLTVNREQKTIVVVGHADTRNHVLEIAKELESLSFAASVESPLSNILQQNNIQFQFTIRMKPHIQ